MVYWCITPGSYLGYPGFESWVGHQLLWTRSVMALDSFSIQLVTFKLSMTASTSFPIHPIIPVWPTKLLGVTSPKKTMVLYSLSWEPQNLTKRKHVFLFCYVVYFVSFSSAYDALIWMIIVNICQLTNSTCLSYITLCAILMMAGIWSWYLAQRSRVHNVYCSSP